MTKHRLEMFFDAVLAIIMTILVLDLQKPPTPNLDGLVALREPYFAYALSFFWCGTMWVNLYRQWHTVRRINGNVLWLAITVLFFSSLVPYVTSYAGVNFYDSFAQALYGSVIFIVSVVRAIMSRLMAKLNPDDPMVKEAYPVVEKAAIIDCILKFLGIIAAYYLWPPVSMIIIIISTSYYTYTVTRMEQKYDFSKTGLLDE